MRYPNGHVLLRNLARDYPVITHGKGAQLFDESGKDYLDAVSGAYVAAVGHGNTEVVAEMTEQLSRVAYLNGTQFHSQVTEQLAGRLAQRARPLGLDRVFFLSSGSEAVEAAIKFARQLVVDRGEQQRTKIIARQPSYHGNTLFCLSASDRPHYKKMYAPLLSPVVQVPAPYPYRFEGNYEKEGAAHYLGELERTIEREGPRSIFAFILEPVAGSSAGASVPPPHYLEGVQALCRKHGIVTIADEVLCGAGRTGPYFASEAWGFCPDVLVLAKGLNGGYAPLSAVLVRSSDVDTLQSGTGNFLHAQTFMQAPCMTAAGLAVSNYLDRHATLETGQHNGQCLQKEIRHAMDAFPEVGSVQGKGMLVGLELVRDPRTKTPFDRSKRVAENLVKTGLENGITLWPNVGQVDGVQGDMILLAPPLNLNDDERGTLLTRLTKTLRQVLTGL